MKKLTARSRWMLYISIFISGLVIFTTILYLINSQKSPAGSPDIIIFVVIILLAVIAVLVTMISRQRMRNNAKNLNAGFFEAYEEIADKLNGSPMSMMEKKETMSDIMGLFILASKDGRSIEDVIGGNIDEFVDQIQSAFGYRSKALFNFLTGIQYSVLYLFMIQLSQLLESPSDGFFNVNIDLSGAFILLPVAFIGVPLMTNFIRKGKFLPAMITPIALLGVFIAIIETLHKHFSHIPWVLRLVEGSANVIPNIFMLLFWILIFILALACKQILRRASIKRL